MPSLPSRMVDAGGDTVQAPHATYAGLAIPSAPGRPDGELISNGNPPAPPVPPLMAPLPPLPPLPPPDETMPPCPPLPPYEPPLPPLPPPPRTAGCGTPSAAAVTAADATIAPMAAITRTVSHIGHFRRATAIAAITDSGALARNAAKVAVVRTTASASSVGRDTNQSIVDHDCRNATPTPPTPAQGSAINGTLRSSGACGTHTDLQGVACGYCVGSLAIRASSTSSSGRAECSTTTTTTTTTTPGLDGHAGHACGHRTRGRRGIHPADAIGGPGGAGANNPINRSER